MPPIHLPPAPAGTTSKELPALTISLSIEETPFSVIERAKTSVIDAFEALANCSGLAPMPPPEPPNPSSPPVPPPPEGKHSGEDEGETPGENSGEDQVQRQILRTCVAEFLHSSNPSNDPLNNANGQSGSTGLVTELPLITVSGRQ